MHSQKMPELTTPEKIEVLKRSRELLRPPGAWIRLVHARDQQGETVRPESAAAACWCLEGALMWSLAQMGLPATGVYLASITSEVREPSWASIPVWTDTLGRTQAEVLARLDSTIKRLKERSTGPVPLYLRGPAESQRTPQERRNHA